MAYVITELCTRDGACVELCPVDCIVPGPKDDTSWPHFYIDPDACIDCGACVPVCPPEAIFREFEVPKEHTHMTQINADYFVQGPGYYPFDLEEQRRPH